MACEDSSRGHHGRAWPVARRGPTGAYKANAEVAARRVRQSERLILPLADGGQQNLRRGKGPHFHPAADGGPGEGIAVRLEPLAGVLGHPWQLGRRAERALSRACRRLTVIGEPDAGAPHVRFDEGALVSWACPG